MTSNLCLVFLDVFVMFIQILHLCIDKQSHSGSHIDNPDIQGDSQVTESTHEAEATTRPRIGSDQVRRLSHFLRNYSHATSSATNSFGPADTEPLLSTPELQETLSIARESSTDSPGPSTLIQETRVDIGHDTPDLFEVSTFQLDLSKQITEILREGSPGSPDFRHTQIQ